MQDPNALHNPRRGWWRLAASAAGLLALVVVLLVSRESTAERSDGDLPATLVQARAAHDSHDLDEARTLFETAERLDGESKDRAEAQRWLALLDWKYHGRFDAARERLLKATELAEPSKTWAALARLETERDDYAKATEAARRATESAETERERQEADLALARAGVAAGTAAHLGGKPLPKSASLAFEAMRKLVTTQPGLLEPSRLLLQSALLLGDGDAALVAWRSYFRASEGLPAANAVADAGTDLARILPAWSDGPPSPAQRIELVSALARSRFFAEAALVARAPGSTREVQRDSEVAAVLAYTDAIERVRRHCESYYRQTLLGKGKRSRFQDRVQNELTTVVTAIEGKDSPADDSFSAVRRYLGDRFGAYISLATTAGYFDLHMGHRVVDDRRMVEQYGESAELRFVALDTLVSNGFQSWTWEEIQHGGWANANVIYQVRPTYAGQALKIWRRLHDPDELREFEERIARESARDDDRAREDPHAFLPGLLNRLFKQGLFGVLERLKAEGLEGTELRTRFLAELEAAMQESSIYAHEGRHAIEKRAGRSDTTEFEAKLSEVAFAAVPRLALGAILSSNIGDDTPHGRANLRIVKGLVEWMKEHRAEIQGLDPDRPLMPQFDRLSDEQIRQAFRSMDPLAQG